MRQTSSCTHVENTTASATSGGVLVLLLLLAFATTPAIALPHTYYVPLPEEQVRIWGIAIDQGAFGVSDDIHSVISLTATLNGTVVYYDHWEDGFEYDLANPVQPNSEVWGDQDCSNGFTPLLGVCTPGVDDVLDAVMAGDVLALENDIEANPRNQSTKYWDGGDKIGSNNLLAVTRAAWPAMVGTYSGVVLAGAVEVYPTSDWGTAFESPVGEDITSDDMFEYTALAIMAQADNTFVQVDADADDAVDVGQWLQEGESLLVESILVGAKVDATMPVQVDVVTGDVNTTYEARWFALVPTEQWSNAYFSPVGETNVAAPVTVVLYNPSGSSIDVDYETLVASNSVTVPAGGVYEFTMPANSGARFATPAAPFYAISTIDYDSTTHDWGFSLIPETSLATSAQTGWAPGSSDLSENGSPVWVTAEADTTLYIDYDGDGTFDTTSALSRLQSLRIFDPDNDQTGMRIYTDDGTRIAAAWGQDPGTAGPGSPYIDLGTTVVPFTSPLLSKDVELYIDQNSNGVIEAGDTLLYTVTIKNIAAMDFIDGVLVDEPDSNTAYVASTTRVDGVLIADGVLPATPYPLDEAGYDLPTPITSGQTVVVTYQMEVDDPLPPGVVELVNDVTVTSGDASTTAGASSKVQLAGLLLSKTSDAIGEVSPGQIISYTVTVENISSIIQTNVRVTDFLPLGTAYVAESTLASSPSMTMDNVPGGANPDLQDGSLPTLIAAGDGSDLAPGEILTVTYRLQVDDPLDEAIKVISNFARAKSVESPEWVSDSDFILAPTLALVSSFTAFAEDGAVVVEWETASEVGTAGFYLYRWDRGPEAWALVNEQLLSTGADSSQGALYQQIDRLAPRRERLAYALVEVEAGGGERVHGPYHLSLDWNRSRSTGAGIESRAKGHAESARVERRLRAGAESEAAMARIESTDRRGSAAPESRAVEIRVRETGLYKLETRMLAGEFGVSPEVMGGWLRHGQLVLESHGRVVPMQAASDPSEVYFFGEALDSLYGLDNVYWLRVAKAGTTSWSHVRSDESPLAAPAASFAAGATAFSEHLHFEQDLLPAVAAARDPEADYWFWEGIVAGDESQGSKRFALSVPSLEPNGGDAELAIEVLGVSDTPSSRDHHLVVRLNGTDIGGTTWDGVVPHRATFSFSSSLLADGENEVEVEGLLDGNAPYSLFFVDSFDLVYRRLLRAENDRLMFTAERGETVTIDGFASPSVRVYDVTAPWNSAAVPAEASPALEGHSVRLRAEAGHVYLAVGQRVIARPAIRGVEIDPRADLLASSNAADYLLIAPSWLSAGARALADHRRGDGLETRVVALEEVYRQFNHGLASPHALASFLEHANREWRRPPRYVVLIGAGTFDYKDHLGLGGNLIPPIMVGTPWGIFASDAQFGDVAAGEGPEIAIGRLPVLSATELDAYVEKLANYESHVASGRALLLADDPDGSGDYIAASDVIEGLLGGWEVEKVYLSREPLEDARADLFTALERGVSLVNYVGHGGLNRLTHEGLLTESDLPRLAHLESPPVVAALTCVVGRFEIPGFESLAESLVLEPDGGAVAMWSSSGLSINSDGEILDQAFVGALAGGGDRGAVLGDAVLTALGQYAEEGRHPFLWRTYNLLGDPALPLHRGKAR